MPINTDAILWYNVGKFGDLGYAVPNFSNDVGSLNPTIINFTNMIGQNLFAIMHHEDVDLRTPPSINTIRRVHKLYLRFGQLINARAVPPEKNNLEPIHIQPAGDTFKVYPIPYFRMRNRFLQEWAGLAMMALAEAMQHSENAKAMEISTKFAADIGKYFKRLYRNMAADLFGKTPDQLSQEGFILTEADLGGYDPSKFFTSTEMVDTVPHLGHRFTEDRLGVLREGIVVTSLPELTPWPTNLTSHYNTNREFRDANQDADATSDGTENAPASAGGGPVIPDPQP